MMALSSKDDGSFHDLVACKLSKLVVTHHWVCHQNALHLHLELLLLTQALIVHRMRHHALTDLFGVTRTHLHQEVVQIGALLIFEYLRTSSPAVCLFFFLFGDYINSTMIHDRLAFSSTMTDVVLL